MKKALFVGLFVIFAVSVFAQDYKQNVYQKTVYLDAENAKEFISFPYQSCRSVSVLNGDTSHAVWVDFSDVSSSPNVVDTAGSIRLAGAMQLTLENYSTSGVTVYFDQYVASPVSILATY